MKKTSRSRYAFIWIAVVFFVIAFLNLARDENYQPLVSTGTSEGFILETQQPSMVNPTLTSTPYLNPTIPFQATPTIRVFEEADDCDSFIISGYILFLQSSVSAASGYDLYIMDGSACSKHLLMKNVSGSPSWSVDGKKISVGCENNRSICIIDAPTSLNTCIISTNRFSDCVPVISDKYDLPSRGENMLVYSLSWSYDGKRIAVESGDFSGRSVFVDILTLGENHSWQLIIEGDTFVHSEMSPIRNEILIDGIYVMPLNNDPLKAMWYGFNGIWAHDGTKIAFLRNKPSNEDKEAIGIAEWDFGKTPHWRWLYEPQYIDRYYWPPQNLDIGNNNFRILSWSPDNRYLAFVASRAMEDSQILRLDTTNGEIVVLTTKFEERVGYYAPAWSP